MTVDVTLEGMLPLVSALLFAGMAAVTLAGAVVAVATNQLVRSVSGLALSFMGLAGLYYFLHSPFLALMQVLIYVGAVCVMIMFALMLADTHVKGISRFREMIRTAGALLTAGLLALGLILLIGRASWMPPAAHVNAGDVPDMGRALLGRFGFVFELISAVLLLAILGALVVARHGRRAEP
jgi:NADH-quinone oxidoreductase subunit J